MEWLFIMLWSLFGVISCSILVWLDGDLRIIQVKHVLGVLFIGSVIGLIPLIVILIQNIKWKFLSKSWNFVLIDRRSEKNRW